MSVPGNQDSRIGVLFVIWALERGGAERVVAYLADTVDRKRFRPVICCLDWRGSYPVREDVPVYCLEKKRGIDLKIIPKLVRVIRREKIDVINAHMWTANLWARLAAVFTRTPVVVTEHNIDVWKSKWYLLADRILKRCTCHMIAVSGAVKRFYLENAGYPDHSVTVVTNGIVPEEFDIAVDRRSIREKLGIKEGEGPVLGVVGRLVPQKGHRYLLQVLPEMAAAYPDLVLLVVGDGPERAALELEAEREAPGRVKFIGVREDIAGIYGVLDLLVMPSLREGFPMTLLEALAAGVPAVVTDAGDNRAVISEPIYGEVVHAGSVPELAAAILRQLARPSNPAACAARKKYIRDRHSVRQMTAATEKVLAAAAGRS